MGTLAGGVDGAVLFVSVKYPHIRTSTVGISGVEVGVSSVTQHLGMSERESTRERASCRAQPVQGDLGRGSFL